MADDNERRCTAQSKQSGDRCRRYPALGARVCHIHGSKSPQARRKAAERIAEADARRYLNATGIQPVADPLTELQNLAGEAVGWKNFFAGKVAELQTIRYDSPVGEQLRAEVVLFERGLDRCNKFLTNIAKLRIDERLVAIRERETDMLERAMNTALLKIGLSDEQLTEARVVIAGELRALEAG